MDVPEEDKREIQNKALPGGRHSSAPVEVYVICIIVVLTILNAARILL